MSATGYRALVMIEHSPANISRVTDTVALPHHLIVSQSL